MQTARDYPHCSKSLSKNPHAVCESLDKLHREEFSWRVRLESWLVRLHTQGTSALSKREVEQNFACPSIHIPLSPCVDYFG